MSNRSFRRRWSADDIAKYETSLRSILQRLSPLNSVEALGRPSYKPINLNCR
jgi:hypothetical protein